MDSAKTQLADKLKSANNVLVTVSRNPSVDQLAACLGLTLLLNKLNKHTAAVFSGQVPSTIEFLQPEETLEKNTDSLRDFIIALDKSKADKLRYKVEDNVVRIFITPYKTSISQEDLEFSQGDFNVDVVVALGVRQQEELDDAITAHGRILHDATVASINTTADGGLGSINWQDPQASSLSELVTELAQLMGDNLLDTQIATALLTGIVAATDRFSNDKTSSQTMSASAALMAAGANQQLVATKLEESSSVQGTDGSANNGNEGGSPAKPGDDSPKSDNGTLQIDHQPETEQTEPSAPSDTPSGPQTDQKSAAAAADATPSPLDLPEPQTEAITAPKAFGESATPHAGDHLSQGARLMTEPPTLGGALTANTLPEDEDLEASTDLLGLPKSEPGQLLSRDNSTPPAPPAPQKPPEQPVAPEPKPVTPSLTPPPSSWTPLPSSPPPAAPSPSQDQPADTGQHTLAELEESVHSPHLDTSSLNAARDEVTKALNDSSASTTPGPIQALNAQPLGDNLHPTAAAPNDAGQSLADTSLSTGPGSSSPVTPAPVLPTEPAVTAQPQVIDSTLPPPVPPPIPFQFGTPGAAPPQQQ